MKRIVLFFAVGLMIFASDVFAQFPALQKGSVEAFEAEYHIRARELAAFLYLDSAEKIGMYEVVLPYEFLYTAGTHRPGEMEAGKEYWLPQFCATVIEVVDEEICDLRFEIDGTYAILKGYPTKGLFCGKLIVLTSPVICTKVFPNGWRSVEFVSKEELAERVAEGEVFDENQLKAIRARGYEKWDYRDGGHFWAKYGSVSKGKIHLIDLEGEPMTVKPAELTPASSAVYRREWKKAVAEERKERAKRKKNGS
ncbi:MAG: hypothetical protein IJD43_04185 [Thermoguttaceae bacterium]|nr:hypothetical protein [Thermoguttaceae bacterium]